MKITFRFLASLLMIIGNHSIDSQQWIKLNPTFEPPPVGSATYVGYFIDSLRGWWTQSNPNVIWHTDDGGEHWKAQINSSTLNFSNIHFIDSLIGWTLSVKTTDGGLHWTPYSLPIGMEKVKFIDKKNGIATGGREGNFFTTDGGENWIPSKIDTSQGGITVHDIVFVSPSNGWLVGAPQYVKDAGSIMKTTDGGKTWFYNQMTSLIGQSVCFLDSLNGYIAGYIGVPLSGCIFNTTDGGKTWAMQFFSDFIPENIFFSNRQDGWAVGAGGYILHTTDGGENWKKYDSPTTSNLFNIFMFNNGSSGYIFGRNATLLKYSNINSTINDVSELSLDYHLLQNYPNPFNPITTISYQLPKVGFVTLKIYDVLGNEVETLVNEMKEMGKYTAKFSADGGANSLGSGMYFYQIKANDFTAIKKMVLLK